MASVGRPANSILERHEYPQLVATLQAEALALAACLSSTLKFDGVFTLQAKGDGLVRTLFADITEAGHLRGFTLDVGAELRTYYGYHTKLANNMLGLESFYENGNQITADTT